MRDKIKILVVEPMKPCEVREIPDTLEAMQALVADTSKLCILSGMTWPWCAMRRGGIWACLITAP